MGFVFCLVVEKTGSIIYSIIIHFCNNFIVKLIEYYNIATNNNFTAINITSWWHIMLIVLGAVAAFVVIWFIIKKLMNSNTKNCVSNNLESKTESHLASVENNELQEINNNKKQENMHVYVSLAVGFVFWLLMVITSLV